MPINDLHPVVAQIKNVLDTSNIEYEYMEHPPVRTSQEAAKIRGGKYTLEQGAKALIVRVRLVGGGKYFAMLVVPGNKKFDMQKVKDLLTAKDIRFATEKEVSDITGGIKVGGVPPFGNLFELKVYVDEGVINQEIIIFNCGDKRASIAMNTKDYLKVVSPKIVNIT